MSDNMKQCPYCGEKILEVAKKCKYCGTWLNTQQNETNIKEQKEKTVKGDNTQNLMLGYDLCGLIFSSLAFFITLAMMVEPSDSDFVSMCLGWIVLEFFPLAIAVIGLFKEKRIISFVTLGITCLTFCLLFFGLLISALN